MLYQPKEKPADYDWSLTLEKDLSMEAFVQNQPIEHLLEADTYSVIDKISSLTSATAYFMINPRGNPFL